MVYKFMMDVLNDSGVHGEGIKVAASKHFYTSPIRLAKEVSSYDEIFHGF